MFKQNFRLHTSMGYYIANTNLHLTKEIGIDVDVRQEPSSVDLDDKGFCCPFLQNNFGSCNRFVLLLYRFSHVALRWMLMLLMRHVFGASWGTNSETHPVERFSQSFLPAICLAFFIFAKTQVLQCAKRSHEYARQTVPQPF